MGRHMLHVTGHKSLLKFRVTCDLSFDFTQDPEFVEWVSGYLFLAFHRFF